MISLPAGKFMAKYIDNSALVPFMCDLANGTWLNFCHLISSSGRQL